MAYSLRAKYRFRSRLRNFVPLGNTIMGRFIGYCKQKKIGYVVTETVEDEASAQLPRVINRYFDKAGIKAFAVRENVYLKCRKRFLNLCKHRRKSGQLQSNSNMIRDMYSDFARNPMLRKKLVEMRNEKKRKSLLPSETDMKILGEAHSLAKKNRVILVTDDKDFLNFKDEIEKRLKLEIIALLDLPHFEELISP